MFSLRDTLASVLLGVQIPSNDSPTPAVTGAKKGKKKASKKKSKKTKVEVHQQPDEDDDNDYESLSDSSEKADEDDEEVFPGVAVASANGPSESAKLAATMIYNYESTQLEDQIHVMIRQIAEECNLDKGVVSDTVNRMFESGLQYDNHDEVLKLLKPKAPTGRSADGKSPATKSAPIVPASTVQSGRNAKTASSAQPLATTSVDEDAAAALARFNSAGGGLNHPHHHTRSQHHGLDAKHGREIEAHHTESAPQAHVAVNVAAPVVSAASVPVPQQQQAPSSTKEKLDFVAAYSRTNLYDSLTALCSWASVSTPTGAAEVAGAQTSEKEQKMEAFFQSQALEILLTTLFSDDAQQLSRVEVKGAFQALLQHVLLLQTDPQGTSSVHHIIESLAQLVVQVYALRGAQIMPAFASSSARGNQILAQQVAACIRKLYTQLSFNSATAAKTSAGEASGDDVASKLDAINAQLQSLEKSSSKKGATATEAAQEKVQNLFLSREIHADKVQLCIESVQKLNAKPKLSSAAVQRPVAATSASAADLSKSVSESSSLIEHILLTEFDNTATGSGALSPVSASSLQSKHQHSHQINSTFERVIYERDNKLAVLNNELGASNLRLQELNAHKQRLLEQVRLCDQEIANVGARSNTLTTDLGNTTYFYQQQLDQLVQTGNTVRKSLQAHDQVNSLISAVRTFETKFAEALLYQHAAAHASAPHTSFVASNGGAVARNTTVITSSAAGMQVKNSTTSTAAPGRNTVDDSKAVLAERLAVLTGSVQSYVAAEAQCIQFLAQRVVDAQVKQAAARKELLAYAALMMKGQVVATAEATVSQLDAEISEDQQAVRQLQQNVADSLAQVRALDGSNTGRIPSGKSTFNFPASELALIVQSCNSIGVSPAAEIVLLAGKAPVPAPVVQPVAPVVAVGPAAAPVAAVAKAPRTEKAAKTERDGNRRDNKSNKRTGSDVQKSEVDTSSAIQQLERSCLQKPSTGSGAPVKVAAAPLSTRTGPAPRTGISAAPVNSVWKIPAVSSVSSDGIQESKSEEGVKSLKDIQAEQQNEKTRLLQQKHHQAAVSLAATVVAASGPTPAEAVAAVTEPTVVVEDAPAAVKVVEDAVVEESVDVKVKTEVKVEVKVEEEATEAVTATPTKSAKKKAKSATPKSTVTSEETKTEAAVPTDSTTTERVSVQEVEGEVVKTESAVFEALPKRSPKKKSKAASAPASASASVVESVDAEENVAVTEIVPAETVTEPVATVEENVEVAGVEVANVVAEQEQEKKVVVEEVVEEVVEVASVEVTPQKPSKQVASEPVEAAVDLSAVVPTVLNLANQSHSEDQEEASTESKERTPAHVSSHITVEEVNVEVTPVKQAQSDAEGHSTPVPSIAADLSAEGAVADAVTPTADSRPHADSFISPLVEFHHAYKIKEIGIPVIDNEEGDVNPMKGPSSPVVNYLNTYPELEEECDLLIEMEVEEEQGESSEDEQVASPTPSDAGDVLGYSFNSTMMNSANNSITSKSSTSKMRDINPMTRPSPGKGSRVRLDISQVTESDAADSADNTPSVNFSDTLAEAQEEEKSAVDEKQEESSEQNETEKVEEKVVQEVSEVDAVEVQPVATPAPQPSTKETNDSEFAPTFKSKRFAVFSANQSAPLDTYVSDAASIDAEPGSTGTRSVAAEEDDGQGHTVRSKRFAVYSGNPAL